jgi:hypothetical protein
MIAFNEEGIHIKMILTATEPTVYCTYVLRISSNV